MYVLLLNCLFVVFFSDVLLTDHKDLSDIFLYAVFKVRISGSYALIAHASSPEWA